MAFLLRSLVVLVPALVACGDDGASTPDAALADASLIDAIPRETIDEPRTLAPGEFAEATMTGGPGDMVGIHLEAPTAKMAWNIHGHADGGTQTVYEEFNKMTADYVFVPTAQAEWYLLVRNDGATDMTVQIRVDLFGTVQWAWL